MPIFVSFVVGAKEAYFFNSPTHWAWRNLPSDVEALFTRQPPIKDVIEFALGDLGTYFVSYRDHDDQILCRHYNLPDPLTSWLYNNSPNIVRDLGTLSITLGPYSSYYAHDASSASWSNLPAPLEKALLARLVSQSPTSWKAGEAPNFVTLGPDGSYFMRTISGGGSWDLKSKAQGISGINTFLSDSPNFVNIAGLYLFPAHPECYILLMMDGKTFSNLPEWTWEDYNKLAPALPPLAQATLPIPCMPLLRMVTAPQQQLQAAGTGCCPSSPAVNNCCPQQPVVMPPPYMVVQPQPQPQNGNAWGMGAPQGFR